MQKIIRRFHLLMVVIGLVMLTCFGLAILKWLSGQVEFALIFLAAGFLFVYAEYQTVQMLKQIKKLSR
ncbi:hypothetical protein ACVR05_09930 [Streptococcus caprae]|uniref:Uncharacterized protein n=1 Tax=Streptococcus caprae TaxID=1640501 RepID=A0ABV8CWV5_9STRE